MAELLAPAGTIEALDAAFGEGADAVYLGLKFFNARMRTANFAWNQFEAAVYAAHKRNKKIFVTVNTVLEERETERMYRFLAYLNSVKPDGIIVQDLGVARMAETHFPELRLHGSTQMNISSARGANLLGKEGFKRVVLSRELSLPEINAIKTSSNIELEVFVHGALCVSQSGLCLFSSYLGGKSANRGICAQACRRLYSAKSDSELQEGYFFSPHDLQLIEKIPDLIEAGISSFKIEGRMKSAEYVGTVVAAYRYLMDNYQNDKKGAIASAKRILANDFAREKTLYWYTNDDGSEPDSKYFLNPKQAGGTGIFLGKITSVKRDKNNICYGAIKNSTYDPQQGDSIRIHKSDDTRRESHKVKTVSTDERGTIWIDIPPNFSQGDSVYLIQMKTYGKRYEHFLPRDLTPFRKQPGAQPLPQPPRFEDAEKESPFLPEGLYVQVSSIKDLYALQIKRPVKAILEYNTEIKNTLLNSDAPLPFSKKEIIISLEPFFPESLENELFVNINKLIDMGYYHWIVNNPGHISFFKQKNVTVIAGPYLYVFNRWALNWLNDKKIYQFISPIENSRQNLEKTVDPKIRKNAFVTVFAYPALFRMRFKLPAYYDFVNFSDKQEGEFRTLVTPEGSFVLPENPFSIVDKLAFLKNSGFKRFIIDFSKVEVNKQSYRRLIQNMEKGIPLPETTRFNWKDGFYSPEHSPAAAKEGKTGDSGKKPAINRNRGKSSKTTGKRKK